MRHKEKLTVKFHLKIRLQAIWLEAGQQQFQEQNLQTKCCKQNFTSKIISNNSKLQAKPSAISHLSLE